MSINQKNLGGHLASTDFESESVLITTTKDYKETASLQRSLSDLFELTNPSTEVMNPVHGFSTSLVDEMKIEEVSASAPCTARTDSKKTSKKKLQT